MMMPVVAEDDCTSAVNAAAAAIPSSGFCIRPIASMKGS